MEGSSSSQSFVSCFQTVEPLPLRPRAVVDCKTTTMRKQQRQRRFALGGRNTSLGRLEASLCRHHRRLVLHFRVPSIGVCPWRVPGPFGANDKRRPSIRESCCLGTQPKSGGKLHPRPSPIVDKYREGKLKITLERIQENVKPPRGKRVAPLTAIAGGVGLSLVLLTWPKRDLVVAREIPRAAASTTGRRGHHFGVHWRGRLLLGCPVRFRPLCRPSSSYSTSTPSGFCFCTRVANGRDGPRGTRRTRRSLLLPSWLLLSIPRDHPKLFFARHHMARALRRHANIRTASTGCTSPPVRRRAPFPACRSTHSKPSCSRVGGDVFYRSRKRTAPFCRGRRKRKRDPLHVTNRFLLVRRSAQRFARPQRPTVSGVRGTVFAGASKPARPRRFPCRRASSSRCVVFFASRTKSRAHGTAVSARRRNPEEPRWRRESERARRRKPLGRERCRGESGSGGEFLASFRRLVVFDSAGSCLLRPAVLSLFSSVRPESVPHDFPVAGRRRIPPGSLIFSLSTTRPTLAYRADKDPRDGDPRAVGMKPEETLVEVRSASDVQIDRLKSDMPSLWPRRRQMRSSS
ncbi:unnamed protein product [Acanthosepion pharaonis]|uniref:Uncharacterized protein n=1 Tax=Acanthosepion pharaonis TaxID=158019 RepID=A0A812CN10_ACAPH|nr:unnamed protein product [Sepia pharaonis]